MKTKPIIYWILQDNQITPGIVDFLSILRIRVEAFVSLKFLIPEMSQKALEKTKKLNPVPFKVSYHKKEKSLEGYTQKRDELGNKTFKEGLKFWQPLLLDDLGAGSALQLLVIPPKDTNVVGIILQIPTPLGSSENEERIFYAWAHMAKLNKVPVIGYELLPLATRWTLAPALLDGIITTRPESYRYLTGPAPQLNARIWRVPRCEGRILSPAHSSFFTEGLGVRYKYQKALGLAQETTILYIPHNVAMTYEYNRLIQQISPLAQKLHLMFSIGHDQVRGGYSHQETIEIIGGDVLHHFSYSFHDMNHPQEMTMADGLLSASDCYGAEIAAANGIPVLIHDTQLPSMQEGFKLFTGEEADVLSWVKQRIRIHREETEFSYIFMDILNTTVPPKVKND